MAIVALMACSANTSEGRGVPTEPRLTNGDLVRRDGGINEAQTTAAAPIPSTSPSPSASPPSSATLSAESVKPYFTESSGGAAVKLFELEKWADARKAFIRARLSEKDPDQSSRMQLMIALCNAELGAHAKAANSLAEISTQFPVLANFTNYRAALSYFRSNKLSLARKFAQKVQPGSLYAPDATLLLGDLFRVSRQWRKMRDLYQAYLNGGPQGHRLSEARYRYAQAMEKTGATPSELIKLYRTISSKGPLTQWARLSNQRIGALVSRLPRSARVAAAQFTAREHLDRGLVLYRNQRNQLSEEAFTKALEGRQLDVESRCIAAFHRANSVYKQRDRRRAAPLFEDAIRACNASTNVDLQVKSYYQAGRCYGLTSRSELAIARYGEVEKRHPGHSYADDARLRAAEEYRDLGNQTEVTRLLSTLPTIYPNGDMRAEAMWRLGWRAFKAKHYPEVLKWLRKQIEVKPIDNNYYAEGQAQYWMGRTFAEMGQVKQSIEAYRQAILTYPMSYYSALALNRIREADPTAFAAIKREISTPPSGFNPNTPAFQFKDRDVYQTREFKLAIELLRLRLGREARRQLNALGFVVPAGKKEVTDDDAIDKIWAMAFLNHHAGQYSQSHWVTRWHVLGYKRKWPVGHNTQRWRIAFPLGWWPLLEKHAKKHGYPAELLIAFVREESAFNPLQESFANAIGLTQMIFPTARRFAKGTGIVVSRSALRDPEKNVTIGGRFLSFLYDRFGGRVSLVVPSYNAGEGATDRWLRVRGDWAMDAWAEEVPYDETRRYSKRVIASFFTYNYLRDGTIPVLPNTIPQAAIDRANR